jgi:hypothetical protein
LDVDSNPWEASLFMLVVGVGLGLVMQVLVLIVQNDAPAGHRRGHLDGHLFRSVGGSFGVALFRGDLRVAAHERAHAAAGRHHRELGDVGAIDPARARQLPPEVLELPQIFANALRRLFRDGDRDRPGRPPGSSRVPLRDAQAQRAADRESVSGDDRACGAAAASR